MRRLGFWIAMALLVAAVLVLGAVGGAVAYPLGTLAIVVCLASLGVAFALTVLCVRCMFDQTRRQDVMKTALLGTLVLWLVGTIVDPLTPSQREASKRYTCLSNVKQLASANHAYIADFDEVFPRAAHWYDAIGNYIKGEVRCPDAKTKFSYGMNKALGGISMAKISAPDKTVLYLEMDSNEPNPHGWAKDTVTRHPGWCIIALADGSAKNTIDSPPKWVP